MSPIIRINDLIDRHGATFVKCPGCEKCEEIKRLRGQLELRKKDACKSILAKGQEMKRDDIQTLLEHGFSKTEIAKALKMDHGTFYEMLERWGLSNRKRGKGEMEIMETVEAKELTYDVYKRLKAEGVSSRAIAGKYRIKENTLYTKVHKWKKKVS